MTPSKRDKDIDVVMKQSQQAIDIAKANLRSYLTVEEYEFQRILNLTKHNAQKIIDNLNQIACPNDIEDALTEAVWSVGRHFSFAKTQ